MLKAAVVVLALLVTGCAPTFKLYQGSRPSDVALLVHRVRIRGTGGINVYSIDGKTRGFGWIQKYEIPPGVHRMTVVQVENPLGAVIETYECLTFEASAGGQYELQESDDGGTYGWHTEVVDLRTGRTVSRSTNGKCEDLAPFVALSEPVSQVLRGRARMSGCAYTKPLGNGWNLEAQGRYYRTLSNTQDISHVVRLTIVVNALEGVRDPDGLLARMKADLENPDVPRAVTVALEVAPDSTLGPLGVRYHVRYVSSRIRWRRTEWTAVISLHGIRVLHPKAREVMVGLDYADVQYFKKDDAARAATAAPETPVGAEWEAFCRSLEFVQPLPGLVSSDSLGRAMPDGLVTGHGSVWVARQASGDVLRIDPTNGRIVARIPIGRAQATDTEGHLPSNLTVGENAVWALNSAEGTAYWIDATTNSVAGSVHLGSVPLALVQSAGSVWVADYREGTVARIDVATHQVLGKPTNIGWLPTAILPHQGSVWVLRCGTENRLFRIDPGTGTTVGKPIRLGPSPGVITREVAIGAGSFWAFAQPSVVQRIDPTSGALLASIEVPTQVSGIAFGHDRLWLCDRSGYISKIDPATNRFEGDPIPAGLSLSRIYAADDALWVADELAGSLIKVPYK